MLIQVLILMISIAALYLGAEWILEEAEKIGRSLNLSPLIIGLLLIGFGTSLPELFVAHLACLREESEVALGNIVGSNVANLFLIMGVAGLFSPLSFLEKDIKMQLLMHLIITALLTGVLFFIGIGPLSFFILAFFFCLYLWFTYSQMSGETQVINETEVRKISVLEVSKLIFGLGLLYFGGKFLISSGSKLAIFVGISTYTVSAIFMALGTSFPELVTALIASFRKKDVNLITGNILGSNIFNVAFVMGGLGFYDISFDIDFRFEIASLWMAAIFLVILSLLKKNFVWVHGLVFLGIYTLMVCYWIRI